MLQCHLHNHTLCLFLNILRKSVHLAKFSGVGSSCSNSSSWEYEIRYSSYNSQKSSCSFTSYKVRNAIFYYSLTDIRKFWKAVPVCVKLAVFKRGINKEPRTVWFRQYRYIQEHHSGTSIFVDTIRTVPLCKTGKSKFLIWTVQILFS